MEVIKPIWGIYNLVDKIKSNNEKCPHILSRLDALQRLVEFVQQKEADQLSEDVIKALEKLNTILESAKEVLSKFNKQHVMQHMMKAGDYKLEFENLNKSLTDAFVTLSGALHVHQEETLVEQESMLAEQENKLQEMEKKLAKQERKLVEQEDRLAEQEDIVQRLESKIAYQSTGYYCILQ
ncbi:hypothetical protein GBF38_020107 [Nibea albiflora]|uniref:Uncharacterized protein n=1 Tax=Nibea albiflora TaxID=240163 RepID=A0ACB7FDR4_NIBAL|nr:hypothetical protein GBF38_020107 [Nibea albiflora]